MQKTEHHLGSFPTVKSRPSAVVTDSKKTLKIVLIVGCSITILLGLFLLFYFLIIPWLSTTPSKKGPTVIKFTANSQKLVIPPILEEHLQYASSMENVEDDFVLDIKISSTPIINPLKPTTITGAS